MTIPARVDYPTHLDVVLLRTAVGILVGEVAVFRDSVLNPPPRYVWYSPPREVGEPRPEPERFVFLGYGFDESGRQQARYVSE